MVIKLIINDMTDCGHFKLDLRPVLKLDLRPVTTHHSRRSHTVASQLRRRAGLRDGPRPHKVTGRVLGWKRTGKHATRRLTCLRECQTQLGQRSRQDGGRWAESRAACRFLFSRTDPLPRTLIRSTLLVCQYMMRAPVIADPGSVI